MLPHKGFRKYIAIAGRRNVGKSSFMNALAGQQVSIVSEFAGTTTDPVFKTMELHPLGPVTLIDTPGLDDVGELGQLRVQRAIKMLYRADVGILLVDSPFGEYEKRIVEIFNELGIPFIVAINKVDILGDSVEKIEDSYKSLGTKIIKVSALQKEGMENIGNILDSIIPKDEELPYMSDLIGEGDFVILVMPQDRAAPKGRLIMPEAHAVREVLDSRAICVALQEPELSKAYKNLIQKPRLVVTDSQVVMKVVKSIDEDVPLTTFSILEARYRGDLSTFVDGVRTIENLQDGDTVVILEGCSHAPVKEVDIGRTKIPNWIEQYTGKELNFKVYAGVDMPEYEDLEGAKLVVHCGGCVLNRNQMMRRLRIFRRLGIPVTNYGITISYLHGILERVVQPFGLSLINNCQFENSKTN